MSHFDILLTRVHELDDLGKAGAVLYWATQSVYSVIQQWFITGWGQMKNWVPWLPELLDDNRRTARGWKNRTTAYPCTATHGGGRGAPHHPVGTQPGETGAEGG